MLDSDPYGRWMAVRAMKRIAEFVVDMLDAEGGSADYSWFFEKGEDWLASQCGAPAFLWFDIAVGFLEQEGIVATETLATPRDDAHYDYRMTLVGEPCPPCIYGKDGLVWSEDAPQPSGMRPVDN